MPDTTALDQDLERRQRQLEQLDRLAQRFGTSLSTAFAKNAADGRRLDDVLNSVGRTLLNASLRAAMKPLRSGLTALFKSALASGRLSISRLVGGSRALLKSALASGRLGVSAAGAGARPVQVTVNIATPDADSFRRSEAQVAAALARAVARGQRGL